MPIATHTAGLTSALLSPTQGSAQQRGSLPPPGHPQVSRAVLGRPLCCAERAQHCWLPTAVIREQPGAAPAHGAQPMEQQSSHQPGTATP